jgi:hypothetical protein
MRSISARASSCAAGPKRPVSLAPADTLGLTTTSPLSSGIASPLATNRVGTVGADRDSR